MPQSAAPPLRVLIVGNFLSHLRGTRSVCEDLTEHLRAESWEVVTTSNKPGRAARLIDMMVTTWSRRHDYDVAQVEVYGLRAFFWAEMVTWVLRRAHKKYILTLHGGNLPDFAKRWPGRVRRLLRSAPLVVTPSRYLQIEMNLYREDIHLLPNAISLSQYIYRERPAPKPKLVWLRGFSVNYHPIVAVETLALLRKDFPDIHLTMYGPDKGDGTLARTRQAAVDLGVSDCLDMPGPIQKKDIPASLDQYDIFLNTTGYESFGVAVMEAAASGLCIVSTDVGELPYLWENEKEALLVPVADAPAMAQAVRRILTEPGLAERLSRGAYTRSRQYDWATVLPQWKEFLLSLAGKTGQQPL